MRACHPWALQSSRLTPTWRAVRPQLLTVRQTPPEQRWTRKTTLVAPLIRQAAAAAPHSSTLFPCLLTTLCPAAQKHWIQCRSRGRERRRGKIVGVIEGEEIKKTLPIFSSLQHQQALTTAVGVFLGPDTAFRHLLLDASPSLLS